MCGVSASVSVSVSVSSKYFMVNSLLAVTNLNVFIVFLLRLLELVSPVKCLADITFASIY